ncbi:MAG: hypothetical protein QOJ68_1646 [Blastococcus sp.]|nr:hypothetical protein [Blastococcus sp.]
MRTRSSAIERSFRWLAIEILARVWKASSAVSRYRSMRIPLAWSMTPRFSRARVRLSAMFRASS